MKLSIITATYNSAQTVADTLQSVANQSYKNIEHIIIDGASKDTTLAIIKQYPHIAKVISEPDKGIYDAMNKGIRLATGDIVLLLNSDDFLANDNVIKDVISIFNTSNVDAVYGQTLVGHFDTKNSAKTKIIRYVKPGQWNENSYLYGWMPSHSSFFIKKQIYNNLGYFNTSLKSAADYEFMLRVMHKHKIKSTYLPIVCVHFRLGGMSTKNLKNRLMANLEDRKAWKINGLKPYWFTLFFKPIRGLMSQLLTK